MTKQPSGNIHRFARAIYKATYGKSKNKNILSKYVFIKNVSVISHVRVSLDNNINDSYCFIGCKQGTVLRKCFSYVFYFCYWIYGSNILITRKKYSYFLVGQNTESTFTIQTNLRLGYCGNFGIHIQHSINENNKAYPF